MTKLSEHWKVVIQKFDTNGRKIEERISFHASDETATDALLAASEAAMQYEIDYDSDAC